MLLIIIIGAESLQFDYSGRNFLTALQLQKDYMIVQVFILLSAAMMITFSIVKLLVLVVGCQMKL